MTGRSTRRFPLLAAATLLGAFVLGSCSQGPPPLQPGTAAFSWAAADSAWKAGDYVKANEILNNLVSGESEFATRARAWQLIAASGLAEGYNNLADAYESGGRYNRTEAAGFREQVRLARNAASQLSLEAAETFRRFLDNDKNETVSFAFAFPQMETPPPALLAKLNKGILLKGAEADDLQRAMLHRGVAQAALRASDTSKPEVPRAQFLLATAFAMVDESKLYGVKKLDQPQRLQALCGLATEALRLVPASAKTKALQGKIKDAMGKRKAS